MQPEQLSAARGSVQDDLRPGFRDLHDAVRGCGFSAPQGSATAAAAYGTLAAYASTGPVGGSSGGIASASAMSQFTDALTILGLTGTGFITFSFSVSYDGSTDSGYAGSAFRFFENGANAISSDATYHHGDISVDPGSGPAAGMSGYPVTVVRTSAPVEFQFGQPIAIEARLSSSASGDQTADATAALTGITVFDNASNVLSTYQIASESGALYPVPEPSPALQLLGGLALLGVLGSFVRSRR